MNLQEFENDFFESIATDVENNVVSSYEEGLIRSILDYITDSGDAMCPEYCSFNSKMSRISAYDYNDETECLSLFYLVKADRQGGKVNNGKIQQGINFVTKFYNDSLGKYFNKDEYRNTDIEEVANVIKDAHRQIQSLRFFILSDGIGDESALPNSFEDHGDNDIVREYYLWDMQRVFQQERIQSGTAKVEIDFPIVYDTKLKCIKLDDANPETDAYLAIMPGVILAKIYNKYKQALLERNVRTFLQFRGKVNRGIRETLLNEPDMFFAYNNGISSTASEIRIDEKGSRLYITNLIDWQIVNGGQTTASIAAVYNGKNDLSKVYVPLKITVIKDKNRQEELIPKISATANTQNTIKKTDLKANDPYLVDLEKMSRNVIFGSVHWYFERVNGQFVDDLSHKTGIERKTFIKSFPKTNRFTKTDFAKYEMSWNQKPWSVCKGGESNFISFDKDNDNKKRIDELYYKQLIAKCILFKGIDRIVRNENLGGYKSQVVAYTLAMLSLKSNKNLDLKAIWNNQELSQPLIDYIKEIIPVVWKCITQNLNVGAWTKREDCWTTLRFKAGEISQINPDLLTKSETEEKPEELNDDQRQLLEEMRSKSSDFWFNLAFWGKDDNKLSFLERKMALNYGQLKNNNKLLSLTQAIKAREILDKAKDNGFSI